MVLSTCVLHEQVVVNTISKNISGQLEVCFQQSSNGVDEYEKLWLSLGVVSQHIWCLSSQCLCQKKKNTGNYFCHCNVRYKEIGTVNIKEYFNRCFKTKFIV